PAAGRRSFVAPAGRPGCDIMRDPADTIVALASAPGPGARAIIRLSGPDSLRIAQSAFTSTSVIDASQRHAYAGELRLPGLASPLPADLLVWPGPHSYTGQPMAEL